mmetsp:Transcript_64822/g.122940  ORF Transcript_64822/g.122940 Transcript_64822/m.122940 type:complete len:458 (+) Transcript_64822:61-1434(+)
MLSIPTIALVFLLLVCVVDAQNPVAELPYVSTKALSSLHPVRQWWIQVQDRVYHAPSSLLGLSQNITKYYYAYGSESAISDELRVHCVGGQGRWHIFHLPEGPGMVSGLLQSSGARRASLSALRQLQHGMVLSRSFPAYELPRDYVNPLSGSGQLLEITAVSKIEEDLLRTYLSQLLTFPTRSWTSAEDDSQKVKEFLKRHFETMGLRTCFHDFTDTLEGRKLTNVVAHIGGQSGDSVTVGAHYDSRPYLGPAPGAEDNGSGVAALLAIAKAFTAANVSPKQSVYFVAFAAEEPGLLGSKAFAQALESSGDDFLAECRPSSSFLQMSGQRRSLAKGATHRAIILDEVGWRSTKFEKPTVTLESYDSCQDEMDHLSASSSLHNQGSLDVVHNSNPFGSDHMSFLERDMHAVLTINGDDEAYPNYHQSSDTIDNVNFELMAKIAKMNLGALIRMAGVDA